MEWVCPKEFIMVVTSTNINIKNCLSEQGKGTEGLIPTPHND